VIFAARKPASTSMEAAPSIALHCPHPERIRTPDSACESVRAAVNAIIGSDSDGGTGGVSEAERRAIQLANFSNWEHEDARLLVYMRQIYIDVGLVERLPIDEDKLLSFLLRIYAGYNQVPFHNFRHCFMVTQMTYSIIWLGNLHAICSDSELVALLTAAVCHDLDHPGLSNYYQRLAATKIASSYSASPLESHHAATALAVLSDPACDILASLTAETRSGVEGAIQRLILATDMAHHAEILAEFEAAVEAGQFSLQDLSDCSADSRELLLRIVLKTADVSNEARPVATAERWIDCLLAEFFAEARLEQESDISPLPFMNPALVRKAVSQQQFIGGIVLPLSLALARVLPRTETDIVQPVKRQLEFYTRLVEDEEREAAVAEED
uniref:PDEase domain-containing protein n=1 Tax=Macrostomum lignano TaxID=282301 RepID=A0A1I8GGX6_9PLAT